MKLANLVRFAAVFPIVGAWLGCNAIIGLELGEAESIETSSTTTSSTGPGMISVTAAGVGGAGGAGGTTSGSGGSGGMTNGTGGSVSVSSGGGGSGACERCSEFATGMSQNVDNLCDANGPPSSYELWIYLRSCICFGTDATPGNDPWGPCEQECADNFCVGGPLSADCDTCLGASQKILEGCSAEASACLNDM
jgi:hypothetical protein